MVEVLLNVKARLLPRKYIHIYIFTYIHTCIYIYMCYRLPWMRCCSMSRLAFFRANTYIYIYIYLYTYLYIYMCNRLPWMRCTQCQGSSFSSQIHIYMYIFTCIHTCIYININMCYRLPWMRCCSTSRLVFFLATSRCVWVCLGVDQRARGCACVYSNMRVSDMFGDTCVWRETCFSFICVVCFSTTRHIRLSDMTVCCVEKVRFSLPRFHVWNDVCCWVEVRFLVDAFLCVTWPPFLPPSLPPSFPPCPRSFVFPPVPYLADHEPGGYRDDESESCHTYEWDVSHMSHIWRSPCHIFEWVIWHVWMSHVTHWSESRHTSEWIMSHFWVSHITYMNEPGHTSEWVTLHIWRSHMIHLNESHHTTEWISLNKQKLGEP